VYWLETLYFSAACFALSGLISQTLTTSTCGDLVRWGKYIFDTLPHPITATLIFLKNGISDSEEETEEYESDDETDVAPEASGPSATTVPTVRRKSFLNMAELLGNKYTYTLPKLISIFSAR